MRTIDYTALVEPNLLVPGKQPVGNVSADWTHSLMKGMIAYGDSAVIDYVSNILPTVYGANAQKIVSPKHGRVIESTSTLNSGVSIEHKNSFYQALEGTDKVTLMIWLLIDSWVAYSTIISHPVTPTGWELPYHRLGLFRVADDSNVYFRWCNAGSDNFQDIRSDPNYILVDGAWHCYCVTRNETVCKFYRDGALFSSGTTPSGNFGWNNQETKTTFLDRSEGNNGEGIVGKAGRYGIWAAELSAVGIAEIYRDPYQFLIAAS